MRGPVIYSKHLIIILDEITPILSKTGNLSRVALDADASFSEEDSDEVTWDGLDGVISEYAEKISATNLNRWCSFAQTRKGRQASTAGGPKILLVVVRFVS